MKAHGIFASVLFLLACAPSAAYYVGRGIADMTGPPSEVNLMGYAKPSQVAGGIHMRQFARAFIFAESESVNSSRVAYVSCDIGMGSDLVNQWVVEKLATEIGPDIYTYDNLCISGTHTHSGPAGYLQYVLFQSTSFGWFDQTFQAYVDGIVAAIVNAHNDLQEGTLSIAQAELKESNINRSPTSYVLNPDADDYDADTDLNMLLLRLDDSTGEPMGALNWFAVHGTSLNNTNRLISSDNRGVAGYYLEQEYNGVTETVAQGHGDFVAAFASSNLGDVSPNTNGAKCIDTGEPCDAVTSTCNGRNELCIAFGPGENGDMFQSVEIIGKKQYEHASSLMSSTSSLANGPVSYVHRFADMSNQTVLLDDGSSAKTCPSAMGYAFAAGTTDGPGAFNFHQATNETTPFWEFISDILSTPTQDQIDCQAPKPILLNIGEIKRPYQWDADVVPVQLFRIGFLFIAVVPSEFTTMAGRRLRNMIASRVVSSGLINEDDADQINVVIGGLANTYADYVTTFEEYQAQRYEAASTIFGPHTHQAYMQLFESLVDEMAGLIPKPNAPSPPNLYDKMIQAIPNEVKFDSLPKGMAFGQVVKDVNTSLSYIAGNNVTVSVTFQGANPRADLKHGGSYLNVQRYDETSDSWITVANDADFATKFIYKRSDKGGRSARHESHVTMEWTPPSYTTAGTHRIKYYGDATSKLTGRVTPFTGVSGTFEVMAAETAL
jgi:neutral ceramidase